MIDSNSNYCRYMIQSTDELPVNFGFYAKGNTSKTDGLAKELEDQLIAGAIGLLI
jgi:urease alpha subunit